MLKLILILVVVLILAVLALAASKPGQFRVQRATTIKAPPEKIFPLLNDFHNWASWSPWEKLDPTMTRTYSAPASGKGAVYQWEGKGSVGAGRMEITDSSPSSRLLIQLDFLKPFAAHNTTKYTLEPHGGSTTVTWAMYGPAPSSPRSCRCS